MKHALKTLVRPRVIVPSVIGVAMLVGLILFAGPQEALRLITHFHVGYLAAFFLLTAGYEVVRCAQWHYLLTKLFMRMPLRTQIFSYAIGEIAKNVPIGNFVPDYILMRSQGTDFGRTSSSSLFISVLEVAVALAGIVIIGIDDWTWIRPVILIGSFAFGLLVWAFLRWHHAPRNGTSAESAGQRHAPIWAGAILRWKWVRTGLHELRELTQGEATLLHPDIIAVSTLACVVYMLFSGFALYAVILGLGFPGITWQEAMVASFFSLAVSTIVPLPTDLGSSEASGAGVLIASGLSAAGSVSALLLYRFLNLVAQILVAGLGIAIFPGEFLAVWRSRSRSQAKASQPA